MRPFGDIKRTGVDIIMISRRRPRCYHHDITRALVISRRCVVILCGRCRGVCLATGPYSSSRMLCAARNGGGQKNGPTATPFRSRCRAGLVWSFAHRVGRWDGTGQHLGIGTRSEDRALLAVFRRLPDVELTKSQLFRPGLRREDGSTLFPNPWNRKLYSSDFFDAQLRPRSLPLPSTTRG